MANDTTLPANKVHMALCVGDLEQSKSFYRQLFGTPPARETEDQIDWILETPPIHFSIYVSSTYDVGIEHFGFVFPKAKLDQTRKHTNANGDGNLFDPDGNKIELYTLEG